MTPLAEWLTERERLAEGARRLRGRMRLWRARQRFSADARESLPRAVAMLRVAVEALGCARSKIGSAHTDFEFTDALRTITDAIARIEAIARGEGTK